MWKVLQDLLIRMADFGDVQDPTERLPVRQPSYSVLRDFDWGGNSANRGGNLESQSKSLWQPAICWGDENRPHSMFSPIKRQRIKIETSGFQYLQVKAFATSDQKLEVNVIIGQE